MSRPTGNGPYARAVERMWSSLLERPAVLSPRDWALVRDWHVRGVPLQVIREAIDELAEACQKGRRRRPRGLAYVAAAVEEGCAAIREGRVANAREMPDSGQE